MSSEPDRFDTFSENKPKKLLIVRLSAMGDVIHTLPAVEALRQAFPRAHIGWLIEERWAELLCAPGTARRGPRSASRPLVDEVHAVSLKVWRKSLRSLSTLQRMATVWNDVRGAHYDAAVDLQGAMRSALLARLSGASVVYGAAEAREAPASLWYTRKVTASGRHVVEQNLSVAEAVIGQAVLAAGGRISMLRRRGREHQSAACATRRAGLCHLESGRGVGCQAMACRALWRSGPPDRRVGPAVDSQLWPWRGGTGARRRCCKPRDGCGDELHAYGIDCVDAAGAAFYWRRYRASAPGGGIASSGGRNFWANRSGAQRAVWNSVGCAAESGELDIARAPGRAG